MPSSLDYLINNPLQKDNRTSTAFGAPLPPPPAVGGGYGGGGGGSFGPPAPQMSVAPKPSSTVASAYSKTSAPVVSTSSPGVDSRQQAINQEAQRLIDEQNAKTAAILAQQSKTAENQAPAPTAPTAPTTPSPTAGDAYKGLLAPVDQGLQAAYDQYGNLIRKDLEPVDEEGIRQRTMQRFQAEIDALNNFYAQKKAEAVAAERKVGESRLGQSAAIQARRGLLGSTFGEAQTGKIEEYNVGVERAVAEQIDAEKVAAIQSILGKARDMADEEIKGKLAAKRQGAADYITFLKGGVERKEQRVNDTIANILGANVTPDEENYKALAEQLGITVPQLKSRYNEKKLAFDIKQKELVAKNTAKPIEVSPGASLFDPVTGKFIGTAPQKPEGNKPTFEKVGDSVIQYDAGSNTWKVVYSEPTSAKQGKLVKISGVDYIQNPDGSYSLPNVPEQQKQVSEIKQNALSSAQELLRKLLSGEGTSAVGKSRIFQLQRLPGTAPADFEIQFNNLKSLLSLDNVKLLKGQGAVSDAERRLLAEASSKLDLSQSEGEFAKALQNIITGLSGPGEASNVQQTNPQVDETKLNKLIQELGITREEALNALGFNQPLSMGEKGLKKLAQSLITQESGGNYGAIGDVPKGYSEADRALGKYQIIPKFHFSKIGLANTPENRSTFLRSPALQDQLFERILGGLSQQYGGDPSKIAAAYYGGARGAQVVGTKAGDRPQYAGGKPYPSVNQYVNSVLSRIV